MHIPEALAAYRQFIIHGSDKKPLHPVTGALHDPHDSAIWLTAAQAVDIAAAGGYGVGFVFTAADPFFFIDIDDCLTPDGWSTLATQLCSTFAGCYVEVSRSGTGIHIIGSGTAPPDHSCRSPHGVELYTSGRYCALTGTHASGNPAHPTQAPLDWLVASYFPPRAAATDAEWTTGPCAEWDGPADDTELIQRMFGARQSAAAAFGGRASLSDLWSADPSALSAAFPDPRPEGFDRSAADAALCQHLAFWTGRDCERMDRLFRSSGLMRDKWDERRGSLLYGQKTILSAVSRCQSVYRQRPTAPTPTEPTERAGSQYMTITQQIELFKGCVYISRLHEVFTPDGSLLSPDRFRTMFGGYLFMLDGAGEKTTKSAWEAFAESQAIQFPKVHDIAFRPEVKSGEILMEEGKKVVNIYTPIDTPATPGDAGPFLRHVAKLLPSNRDQQILLAYMAALVQHPGVKFQWCTLLQGVEGNGKTLLNTCMAHAVGNRYTHFPRADDIHNKFNAWLIGKLFIGVEEVYTVDRQEKLEALKPLITNKRVDIQGKGENQITGDNRANFMMCSNHRDAIRKTHNDRRYAVFFTAQQEYEDLERDGMNGSYFPALYRWLDQGGYAVVNHFLRTYRIPDDLNPAVDCHRAPETSTTGEAIRASMGGVEQEIMEAIDEGRPGFVGGWVSSLALDRLLDERRSGGKILPNRRRDLMRQLGYEWHPALSGGRVPNIINDPCSGMGKPRLYCRVGGPSWHLDAPAEVVRTYIAAQSGATLTAQVFGGGV